MKASSRRDETAAYVMARELLGWEPQVGLEDGLRLTVKWMKQHSGKYRAGVYVV